MLKTLEFEKIYTAAAPEISPEAETPTCSSNKSF